MSRKPPVRIAEVAQVAGVSAATVSRTLSAPELVAEDTRDRVMAAVRKTGYRANNVARSLRRGRTGVIVVLLPNMANPFFADILAGMGAVLAEAGYDMLVADTEEATRRRTMSRFLDPSRADAVILLDGRLSLALLTEDRPRPPVVTACEWVEGAALPGVALDNTAGAELAARHLAGLGHASAVCIGGPPENVLHRARLIGFRRVFPDAGCYPGDFSLDAGVAAARTWLAGPDRPSAVFAFNDEMAAGFMCEIQRAGLTVPEDLSVVGFDDIEWTGHLNPSLTTVHQPKREIGRIAAGLALAQVAGEPPPPRRLVAPTLTLRGSTGPAPV